MGEAGGVGGGGTVGSMRLTLSSYGDNNYSQSLDEGNLLTSATLGLILIKRHPMYIAPIGINCHSYNNIIEQLHMMSPVIR